MFSSCDELATFTKSFYYKILQVRLLCSLFTTSADIESFLYKIHVSLPAWEFPVMDAPLLGGLSAEQCHPS